MHALISDQSVFTRKKSLLLANMEKKILLIKFFHSFFSHKICTMMRKCDTAPILEYNHKGSADVFAPYL